MKQPSLLHGRSSGRYFLSRDAMTSRCQVSNENQIADIRGQQSATSAAAIRLIRHLETANTHFRFYHSLRAVKVLLAALRSTLTVLASRMGGLYRFALEKQLLIFDRNGSAKAVRKSPCAKMFQTDYLLSENGELE
jgi:hypothetical protein